MTGAEAVQVLRQLPLIEGSLPPDAYAAIERAIELLTKPQTKDTTNGITQ